MLVHTYVEMTKLVGHDNLDALVNVSNCAYVDSRTHKKINIAYLSI